MRILIFEGKSLVFFGFRINTHMLTMCTYDDIDNEMMKSDRERERGIGGFLDFNSSSLDDSRVPKETGV